MSISSIFSHKINLEFIKHIEKTKTLCIYKFGNHLIPPNLHFPHASTLTLLNCNRNGVRTLLNPEIFPNLTHIHYLSHNPGDYDICQQFGDTVQWVFPNKKYAFYDFMVNNGYGIKDANLISKYVTNKEIVDSESSFDIAFKFDLNIPDYGITNGEWYKAQFEQYLIQKNNCSYLIQEMEEKELQRELVEDANYNQELR
jgi:hypothetical protein